MKTYILSLIVIFISSFANADTTASYSEIVVFGDRSLQEHTAIQFREAIDNQRFSAAGTKAQDLGDNLTLSSQIDTYLDEKKEGDSEALYIISIGSNDLRDIRDAWVNKIIDSKEVGMLMSETVQAINDQVSKLVEAGARNIAVLNIPEIGIENSGLSEMSQLEKLRISNSLKIKTKIINKLLARRISATQKHYAPMQTNIVIGQPLESMASASQGTIQNSRS